MTYEPSTAPCTLLARAEIHIETAPMVMAVPATMTTPITACPTVTPPSSTGTTRRGRATTSSSRMKASDDASLPTTIRVPLSWLTCSNGRV